MGVDGNRPVCNLPLDDFNMLPIVLVAQNPHLLGDVVGMVIETVKGDVGYGDMGHKVLKWCRGSNGRPPAVMRLIRYRDRLPPHGKNCGGTCGSLAHLLITCGSLQQQLAYH